MYAKADIFHTIKQPGEICYDRRQALKRTPICLKIHSPELFLVKKTRRVQLKFSAFFPTWHRTPSSTQKSGSS